MAEVGGGRTGHRLRAGGISPLGQRKRLPVVLDASVEQFDTVFCGGGRRGLEIELAPADLIRLTSRRWRPIAACPAALRPAVPSPAAAAPGPATPSPRARCRSRSALSEWSPRSTTSSRWCAAVGRPNGSVSPCTTRVGTSTDVQLRHAATSPACPAGAPGTPGTARRPPARPRRCGTPPARPRNGRRTPGAGPSNHCGASWSATASQAVSSWLAGAGARRPATRYGCSTSATCTPGRLRRARRRDQVGRAEAAARAVAEQQRRPALGRAVQFGPRGRRAGSSTVVVVIRVPHLVEVEQVAASSLLGRVDPLEQLRTVVADAVDLASTPAAAPATSISPVRRAHQQVGDVLAVRVEPVRPVVGREQQRHPVVDVGELAEPRRW